MLDITITVNEFREFVITGIQWRRRVVLGLVLGR
jgi:hypothetical protein